MNEYVIQFEGEFVMVGLEGIQPDHKTIVNEFQNKREAHDFTMTLYDQCLKNVGVIGYKIFQCRRKMQKPMKNFLGERHAD